MFQKQLHTQSQTKFAYEGFDNLPLVETATTTNDRKSQKRDVEKQLLVDRIAQISIQLSEFNGKNPDISEHSKLIVFNSHSLEKLETIYRRQRLLLDFCVLCEKSEEPNKWDTRGLGR